MSTRRLRRFARGRAVGRERMPRAVRDRDRVVAIADPESAFTHEVEQRLRAVEAEPVVPEAAAARKRVGVALDVDRVRQRSMAAAMWREQRIGLGAQLEAAEREEHLIGHETDHEPPAIDERLRFPPGARARIALFTLAFACLELRLLDQLGLTCGARVRLHGALLPRVLRDR